MIIVQQPDRDFNDDNNNNNNNSFDDDEEEVLDDNIVSDTSSVIKCPAANKKGGEKRKKKAINIYENTVWEEQPHAGQEMKALLFYGSPGISNIVQSDNPLEIFELMFTDDLVDYVTYQTNLYFVQNISGKVFKTQSRVMKHLQKGDASLCQANDMRLYIASILYRGIVGKPLGRMYYTQDKYLKLLVLSLLFLKTN